MSKFLSYAVDFASFLLEKVDSAKISSIILFGSVARNEASLESDIDIFIEVAGSFDLKKQIENARLDFFASARFNDYWRLKGINNDINVLAGKVEEWKDIKNSIISNGVVLYGKYESVPRGAVHKTIFSWEKIKPKSRRVLLHKKLFGYKAGEKRYPGLAEKYEGERVGKGSIMVPARHTNVFMEVFREMKIAVKIRKIVEYS